MQFLFALRSRGVTDARVLAAMEQVDRGRFVKGLFAERAYEDTPLPIACGQTISQPSVVGLMTQALQVRPRDTVLEIGTGSGYQAAILSRIVPQVYTVERIWDLHRQARAVFRDLDYRNIDARHSDGVLGLPERAPFEAILVTAAPEAVPQALLQQLAVGGRLVAPVGRDDHQELVLIIRSAGGFESMVLDKVKFVPLLPGAYR